MHEIRRRQDRFSPLVRGLMFLAAVGTTHIADAKSTTAKSGEQASKKSSGNDKGDPVVMRYKRKNGKQEEVTLSELRNMYNQLPAQGAQKQPFETVMPLLRESTLAQKLVEDAAEKEIGDDDEELKEQMDKLRQEMKRRIYLSKSVRKRVTDEKLHKMYDQALEGFKQQPEYDVAMIMVRSKDEADKALKELRGKDFRRVAEEKMRNENAELAKAGGRLGYIPRDVLERVVGKQAAQAVGNLKDNRYTRQSHELPEGRGYVILQKLGSRPMKKPTYEELKPRLREAAARQEEIALMDELREQSRDCIEVYDQDGQMDEPRSLAQSLESMMGGRTAPVT